MSEKQASTAVELLVDCLGSGEDNVELIEQICFALNVYVTANGKHGSDFDILWKLMDREQPNRVITNALAACFMGHRVHKNIDIVV